uniref:Uncharacterized protein n=1 Tax=Oryza sativa subsp. japonica TaxID=39947 RepID=Q8LGW3_ORYSJ|nr:hypothetical protein [Oryza sativa Japonica Group]
MASQPTTSQYLHTWHFKGEEGRHAFQGEEEATSTWCRGSRRTWRGLGIDLEDLAERKPAAADLERRPVAAVLGMEDADLERRPAAVVLGMEEALAVREAGSTRAHGRRGRRRPRSVNREGDGGVEEEEAAAASRRRRRWRRWI